jgi:tripartite ATP-independent transporter DctP family solute receptor
MSTSQGETHPLVEGFREWAKRVAIRTNGNLNIEVYPSSQLGNDEDVIEQAINGLNVAILTDGARMANYVKEMGIIMLPYFSDSYDEFMQVCNSAEFKEWEDRLTSEGLKVINFNWTDGFRHFLNNVPVRKPADLRDQRVRTGGSPVYIESVASLGATPVAMPLTEVYPAVQQKAIDGVEQQNTANYTYRFYEVLHYLNKTSHILLINGIVCSNSWYEGIPDEYKKALTDEAVAIAEVTSRKILGLSDDYEKKMIEAGMELVEVDLDAFKKSSEAVYNKLGYADLRDRIYKQIGK